MKPFWRKRQVDTNPRSRKYRGEPMWMIQSTQLMRYVNAGMLALIIVSAMLLIAMSQ
jgi:hypothetical protein